MKIIHTADWHLGQNFFGYSRKTEHTQFLTWLKTVVQKQKTDVLLIAGDVFDGSNPSAESQKMYFSFLREVTNENPELQIIIIAGNHDSASRLEAPNPLLEDMNINVRGIVKRTIEGEIDYQHLIIPLKKGGFCLAVPYLRQGDFPEAENYSQAVKTMYETLYDLVPDKSLPIIAMGHLQATGSEISENDRSERTIIGGLECVSPDAFNQGIAYTALGHLHRAQRVSGRENVRYAGAPIPMSFAEKNNRQNVVFINTENNTIERIEFEDTVKLLSISNPLNEVLEEIHQLPEGEISDTSPYVEIKVLIKEPEPSMGHQIEEALKGKSVRPTRIEAILPKKENEYNQTTYSDLQSIQPVEMAMLVFEQQYSGEKMPETMQKLLHEVIREVKQ